MEERTLYRGMRGVVVPEGKALTADSVVEAVLRQKTLVGGGLMDSGVGRHWTTDRSVAERFTHGAEPRAVPGLLDGPRGTKVEDTYYSGPRGTAVSVIFEAITDAEHDPYAANLGVLVPEEQEVTITPGTPVRLVSVSIYQGGRWNRHELRRTVVASGDLASIVRRLESEGRIVAPIIAQDGDCIVVSHQVTQALNDLGLDAKTVTVWGWMDRSAKLLGFVHQATLVGDTIVDLTATQFDRSLPAVWVAEGSKYLRAMAEATGVQEVTLGSPVTGSRTTAVMYEFISVTPWTEDGAAWWSAYKAARPGTREPNITFESSRRAAKVRQRAARGFSCVIPEIGREGVAMVRRMSRGAATVDDILRCATDNWKDGVGDQWGLENSEYGPDWADQGAEGYAFVNDDTIVRAWIEEAVEGGWSATDDEIWDELGDNLGEIAVILIGETEAEYLDAGWDAAVGRGERFDLTEVRYNAGWGWKRLPARGHTVTSSAAENTWFDQTRLDHPDWPVIDGVIVSPDRHGQWFESKGIWFYLDAGSFGCMRAVKLDGDRYVWEVAVPVGFGPNSGKILRGTAKTLDAAKDKAMAATKRDDEANARYEERMRMLLHREASQREAASSSVSVEAWVSDRWETADGRQVVLAWAIARDGGTPVGWLGSSEAEVDRVYVLPEYRRRGIATKMLRAVEKELGVKLKPGKELSISGAPWASNSMGGSYAPTFHGEGDFRRWLDQVDRESPSHGGKTAAAYPKKPHWRGIMLELSKEVGQRFIDALNSGQERDAAEIAIRWAESPQGGYNDGTGVGVWWSSDRSQIDRGYGAGGNLYFKDGSWAFDRGKSRLGMIIQTELAHDEMDSHNSVPSGSKVDVVGLEVCVYPEPWGGNYRWVSLPCKMMTVTAATEPTFQSGGDQNGPQYDGWVAAFVGGEYAGHFDWSIERSEPDVLAVRMIEVEPEYRGRGLAMAMIDRVVREQYTDWNRPEPTIHGGMLTDDGAKLWPAVRRRYKTSSLDGRRLWWRIHPEHREFAPEVATSTPFIRRPGDSGTQRGFSCFKNPWHLWVYYNVIFGGAVDGEAVIGFTGERVGTGVDGEDLVVPDGGVVWRMPIESFERELISTDLPGKPGWGHPQLSNGEYASWKRLSEVWQASDEGGPLDHLHQMFEGKSAAWAPKEVDEGTPSRTEYDTTTRKGDHWFYQREQDLYDAGMPKGQVFDDVGQAQRYTNDVLRSEGIAEPCQIIFSKERNGVSGAQWSRDMSQARIVLDLGHQVESYLLHELAHIVYRKKGSRKGPSHASGFSAVYARLLWERMGVSLSLGSFGRMIERKAVSVG